MKQQKLSDLTLEELQKKEKSLKGVIIGLGISWIVLIGFSLFSISRVSNEMKPILILPIVLFITTFLPLVIKRKKIKTEIGSRNS